MLSFNPVHLEPTSAGSAAAFRSMLGVAGFGAEGTGGGSAAMVRRWCDAAGEVVYTVLLTDSEGDLPCFGSCLVTVYAGADTAAEGAEPIAVPVCVSRVLEAAGVLWVNGDGTCYEVHTWCDGVFCSLLFPSLAVAAAWASAWVGVDPLGRFAEVWYGIDDKECVFGSESVC